MAAKILVQVVLCREAGSFFCLIFVAGRVFFLLLFWLGHEVRFYAAQQDCSVWAGPIYIYIYANI